jgi:hypothetical protein
MKPLVDWCEHYAIFYNALGEYIGRKKLDYNSKTFNFLKGTYNFMPLKYSSFKDVGFLGFSKFYFYQLGNPDALILKTNFAPAVISADDYSEIINSDAIRKINALSKPNWLLGLITPLNIIIVCVVAGLIWWITSRGGKLW